MSAAPAPVPSSLSMLSILDFDGTLTGIEGKKLVHTPFYQGLLDTSKFSPRDPGDYMIPMKSNLHELIQEDITPLDARRVTRDAITFLHTILGWTNMTVWIVSRNQKRYIIALLSFCGLTEEEVAKIHVFDVFDLKEYGKADVILECLGRNQFTDILLFDDDTKELDDMAQAVVHCGGDIRLHPIQCPPGQFQWLEYSKFMSTLVPPQVQSPKKRKTGAEEEADKLIMVSAAEYHQLIAENRRLTWKLKKIKENIEKGVSFLQSIE